MFFKICKVCLFHFLCTLMGMGIVTLNFMFTEQINTEAFLYGTFSVAMIFAYFIFGYRYISDEYEDYGKFKNNFPNWFLSLILVLIAIMNCEIATIMNMPFQLLGAMLCDDTFSERGWCILLSMIPSLLIQLGYTVRRLKD